MRPEGLEPPLFWSGIRRVTIYAMVPGILLKSGFFICFFILRLRWRNVCNNFFILV
jgi:hypothetical protein